MRDGSYANDPRSIQPSRSGRFASSNRIAWLFSLALDESGLVEQIDRPFLRESRDSFR